MPETIPEPERRSPQGVQYASLALARKPPELLDRCYLIGKNQAAHATRACCVTMFPEELSGSAGVISNG